MKFDRKQIMKNAWNIRRTANVTMSIALKAAWAVAKATINAETAGQESDWNYTVKVNDWVKGNKNRTYVETRIYTNAWNYKRSIFKVFVDNMTGETVAA